MHLVVHKLFKRSGKRQILQGVNFEIDAEKLTVILGPRNSGKTQLLNILAGIDRPDSGDIFMQGENVTTTKAAHREVGIIFDSPRLFNHLNIYQNLKLVLKKMAHSNLSTEDTIRLKAEELEFSHLLMSLPSDLTARQLFTVQLARALLNEPSLLLIDDPFEQLDGVHYNEIRLLLKKQVTRHNRSLIVTTHFADQAQLLANNLAIIDQGIIQQIDSPDQIYKKPASLHVANTIYTQGFNVIPGRIKQRFKRFIDCTICDDRLQVRVLVKESEIIEYDRNTVYVCLTSSDFILEANEEDDQLEVIEARLLATEKTEYRVCSHWYLDQDTLLEVHTKELPKVSIGSLSQLFFSRKDAFIFSEDGALLSSGRQ